MDEIYVSTDIEADGPVPGPHSMLSLGSAAYTSDKRLIATYSVNLETLPGAVAHPVTARWWENFPDAYHACRQNTVAPAVAMPEYLAWIKALPARPIFVGWPVTFDFMWVTWYLYTFAGEIPFSLAALDIRSYAMAMLDLPFKETVKDRLPREWFDPLPHTHIALDDAMEQGALFCNMLATRRRRD